MDTFDYVIVGGGTAGCILADRLSASGKHQVLLLEAGGEPESRWIRIPAGFSKLLTDDRYNWRFQSEPEPNTRQRRISIPRGKGLGGSTLINGMIYVKGQPADYDRWQALGAQGWNAAALAPYFKRLENYAKGDENRGHEGPVHIQQVRERYPIASAFLAAAEQDGQAMSRDYNGFDQEGFGYYQVTQRNGRRWSVADAYLASARSRPNLQVRTGVHVLRLLTQSGRCTGVVYRSGGKESQVHAARETLLCAGAIQSPQLLELSGIGSKEVLERAGIRQTLELPGVGENYIDHFATRMNWRVRNTVTLNEMSRGWRLALAVAEYFRRHTGILTLGTGLVHGFVKTNPALSTPDIQYFFMHASYANAAERKLDRYPGMTIGVSQMRPTSVGHIHVRSADPSAMPVIKPNFLSTDEDCGCLVEGMKIARRIVTQPAMQHYVERELSPGESVRNDVQWLDFARENGQTIYHPIGTCRMGEDAAAVVDSALRLRGMRQLRVVDASVMPSMVSGNIQAAVMAVAERAADLILQDAGRP